MTLHPTIVIGLSTFLAIGALGCAHASDEHPAGHGTQPPQPAATIEGLWHEETPTECQRLKGDTAAEPLRELKFDGGKFFVTWLPFESYVDYWGTYEYDPVSGVLSFKIESGNHVPADAHLNGAGHFTADGRLAITGIFFGMPGGTERAMHIHTSDCPLVFRH